VITVFRDYVRGVFAEHAERSQMLSARRARWHYRVGRQARSAAVARQVEGVKGVKTDLVVPPQQKTAAAKPQQKTAAKAQQKPRAEARPKRELRAQRGTTPHDVEFQGTGR
jgi:hypothetical protein